MNQPLRELEGTWEEIRAHDAELAGQRVRLIVLSPEEKEPEATQRRPNERMLAALREIEEIQRGMRFTPGGEETQRLIREARAGPMYGYEPTE